MISRRPQAEPGRLVLHVEARLANVSTVRRALEELDLPTRVLDDVTLLATELVTNAIRHAGLGRADLVHVRARWSGTTLRVNVQGGVQHTEAPPVAGSIRPRPGAVSGWGLYLVDQLATRWGTNLNGRPGYWFELEEPDTDEG